MKKWESGNLGSVCEFNIDFYLTNKMITLLQMTKCHNTGDHLGSSVVSPWILTFKSEMFSVVKIIRFI